MKHTFHVSLRDLKALQEMIDVFQHYGVCIETMELSTHPGSTTLTFSFSTEEEETADSLKSDLVNLQGIEKVSELSSERLLVLLS